MPLSVFGAMKEQPQNGGWQTLPADIPGFCQLGLTRFMKLLQASVHLLAICVQERIGTRIGRDLALLGESIHLFIAQSFVPGVGEETIEHPGEVPKVKADGSDIRGTRPKLIR